MMKVKVYGPKSSYIPKNCLNVTSRGTEFGKKFSPFLLEGGPLYYDNGIWYYSKNVENAWQFSKVYKEFDFFGRPTPEYFDWARKGWMDSYAHRYPLGRRKPLYSWWSGEALEYIEARKKIYIPIYTRAVKKIPEFKLLCSKKEISLWDFDVHPSFNDMSFEEILNQEKYKMGHGVVLAHLLSYYV